MNTNETALNPPTNYRSVELTDATRELLKKPTFDIWQWEDSEMLYLLQQMFVDLKLVERLYIEVCRIVFFRNVISIFRYPNLNYYLNIFAPY